MDAQDAGYEAVVDDDGSASVVRDDANETAAAEAAADETLARLLRARVDADTPDDDAAAAGWRNVARLSTRLHREAAALGRTDAR